MAVSTKVAGMGLRAKFIVIDGPDGSGKGTQLDRLQAWIEAQGGTCRRARDPGGTEIGDRIRHVLLGYDLSKWTPVRGATVHGLAGATGGGGDPTRPGRRRDGALRSSRVRTATSSCSETEIRPATSGRGTSAT